MQCCVDRIGILTTLFSEEKLYPSSSRCVTLVVSRIILLSITFTVFFFLFYSPFSLSKKIFRGNSTLIHKSLNNASMSCKTSLTELVFDEWKWERRERKRFHSFIAQKTRSLSKRLRPIVLWNATRSIFVSLFKILSKNVQYLINHIFPFCLIMFEIYVSIFLFLIYRFEFSP